MADEIDKMVVDYKTEMLEKGIVVDEEHEKAFKELLENFGTSGDEKVEMKRVARFIIRQFAARPIAKKIMADYQSGRLQINGQCKA